MSAPRPETYRRAGETEVFNQSSVKKLLDRRNASDPNLLPFAVAEGRHAAEKCGTSVGCLVKSEKRSPQEEY